METYTVIRKRLPKGSHKGRQSAHNSNVGRYSRQRLRTAKNKIAAQEKHLVLHPRDLQAKDNIYKSRAKSDSL